MHTSTTSFVRGDRAGPCSRARARGFVGQAGRKDLVVDGDAGAFVEDLDAEDLGGAHGAVLVGPGQGHVERQHLVGIPGDGAFVEAIEVGDLGIELADGGAHGQAGISRTMELVNRALASGASWVWYWGRISSTSATK